MYLIEKTSEFDKWFRKLRDKKAKAKILIRIQRIEEYGNFGDKSTQRKDIETAKQLWEEYLKNSD